MKSTLDDSEKPDSQTSDQAEIQGPPLESPPEAPAPSEKTVVAPQTIFPLHTWAALYDASVPGFPGEVEYYTNLARHAAGRVLEVGCGTGRITLALARTGVPVVGIDGSSAIIGHVQRQLIGEPAGVQRRTTLLLGQVEQRRLAEMGPFAAIFIPYRGINRFVEQGAFRQMLELLKRHLDEGGVLAFSTFYPRLSLWEKKGLELNLVATDPVRGNRFVVSDTVTVNQVEQTMTVTRRCDELGESGEVTQQHYQFLELRYFFPQELRYLLELAGFRATFYGGFTGSPLTQPDQEVVVAARPA